MKHTNVTYFAPHKKKLVLIFLILPFLFLSQIEFKISGSISDSIGNPLNEAIVSLVKYKNQSLVKTVFTEANGLFEFTNLKSDSFKVVVTQLGFKKYSSDVIVLTETQSDIVLKPIQLLVGGKNLEEVSVVTKVPFVERKADRTIVNPDALISSAGASVLDVLAKSPGVMVDQNGNIKLKGKSGVLILIDDKPTYLTGTELENYLRSIPASSVKQFELMPNPPAHYEAAGNSGIINIRTKKNRLKGINGSFSLNYAQGRYARSNDNFQLNYTTKKFSIFSNLSYALTNRFQDLTIYRRNKNADLSTKSVFTQRTYIKVGSTAYSGRIGMDYYLTPKTTIGVSVKGLYNPSAVDKYNYASLLDSTLQLNSIVIADNKDRNTFTNGTYNLNLRHQLDSLGSSITFDADYVAYTTDLRQTFKNFVESPTGAIIYADEQTGKSPLSISIYAFKSDYTKPIDQTSKLDAGIKSGFTQTNNKAEYLKTYKGFTYINYDFSNQFLYNEWINAAYINYTKSFPRIDFQGGLRFESTSLEGTQLGNPVIASSKFNRDYHNLFPTLYVTYKLDSAANNNLTFSYGRRIDRAFYKDLNPFVSPLDQFTLYSGNPFLRPTFANNASLAYSYKTFFTTTFTYSKMIDKIQETIQMNSGFYFSQPGNIGSSELYNFSFESTLPIKKWLTTTLYSELVYAEYRSKLYTETLNSKGTYWYININNSIQLKKGWSAEISGEYLSNLIDSQFEFGDYGHGTLGVQKRILKDKGSIKVSLSDVFNSIRIRGTINNLRLTDANWKSALDMQVASFTFNYRFGKNTNAKPRHNTNGSESEQKRVKAS